MDPTSIDIRSAVDRLRGAGLYAKGSDPIDWANARRSGHPPMFIRGGTFREVIDQIGLIHNSFFIEASADAPGYVVRFPARGQLIEEHGTTDIPTAIDFILTHWSPAPETILRSIDGVGLTHVDVALLKALLTEGVDAAQPFVREADLHAHLRLIERRLRVVVDLSDANALLAWRVRLACDFAVHCKSTAKV